jgi:hypothetical protein
MDEDEEELHAFTHIEEVEGIVQCNKCKFWGKMPGYIDQLDDAKIKFVCPDCNTIEFVKNPEAQR